VLEQLQTHKVESFADGRYEWVVATASYAVDTRDAGTARIADLKLVPRDADGKVRFRGDVVMLRPTEGGTRVSVRGTQRR
jgi:hypothetical protein